MGSLRTRLTAAVVVVLGLVLAVAGTLAWRSAVTTQRSAFDDRLRRTAELSRATALAAVQEEIPADDRRLDAVLRASQTSVRLLLGDRVLLATGTPTKQTTTQPLGMRTVVVGDRASRILTVTLNDPNLGALARLEVTAALGPLRNRERALAQRLLLIGFLALLVAAAGTWLAAQRVVAPLARLRAFAHDVAGNDDLTRRVTENDGPTEVRSLAASMNAMLGRLGASAADRERALAATRGFAADAGHELRTPLTAVQATLDALARHPEAPAHQRSAMARDAIAEQQRMVALLAGLQALARGDARQTPGADLDLAELVDDVTIAAQHRNPEVVIESVLPQSGAHVRGWEPGVRMLVENLIDNAARHGRESGGHVWVTVGCDTGAVVLIVDDDGPGIAAVDRDRVLDPFVRLTPTRGDGSGLGLAIVAQQTALHGAALTIDASPHGGARFRVRFAAEAR